MNPHAQPLRPLLESLRASGLAVGVTEHLRVASLVRCEAEWSPIRLQAALRCILAKSREQEAAFDCIYESLYGAASQGLAHAVKDPAEAPRIATENVPPRRRRWAWVAAAGVALVVGTTAIHRASLPEPTGQEMEDSPVVVITSAPPALPEGERVLDKAVLARAAAMIGGSATMAAAALALAWRRRSRQRRFWPGPWRLQLHPPRGVRWFSEDDVECAAAALTPEEFEHTAELDVQAAIDATAHQAGLPVLKFARRRRMPHVALLLDRSAAARGWWRLYDELAGALRAAGVPLTHYEYDRHLDELYPLDRCGSPASLASAAEEAEAVVIVGDGSGARDPTTGERSPWIDDLARFAHRLWINPLPRVSWPLAMRDIEATMTVVGPDYILGREALPSSDIALPPLVLSAPGSSVAQSALREYLGPSYSALSAAVQTSPPNANLAVWLGSQVRPRPGHRSMLRMLALPWFQDGEWPVGLLIAMVREASPDEKFRARELQGAVLRANEPPRGSLAHLRWRFARTLLSVDGGYSVSNSFRRELSDSPLAGAAHAELMRRGHRGLASRLVWLLSVASLGLLAVSAYTARHPFEFKQREEIATVVDGQASPSASDGSAVRAATEASLETGSENATVLVPSANGTEKTVPAMSASTLDPDLQCSSLRRVRPPKVQMGFTQVNGRLPPDVVWRIIAQNVGRFQACYTPAYRLNPSLTGRVSVRFIIEFDGSVSSVSDAGSDLPDAGVVSCVICAFNGLSFPEPMGGIVTVVMPIMMFKGTVRIGSYRTQEPIRFPPIKDKPRHLSIGRLPEVEGGFLERARLEREQADFERQKAELNDARAKLGLPPCE